jgi:hypothetical protein
MYLPDRRLPQDSAAAILNMARLISQIFGTKVVMKARIKVASINSAHRRITLWSRSPNGGECVSVLILVSIAAIQCNSSFAGTISTDVKGCSTLHRTTASDIKISSTIRFGSLTGTLANIQWNTHRSTPIWSAIVACQSVAAGENCIWRSIQRLTKLLIWN